VQARNSAAPRPVARAVPGSSLGLGLVTAAADRRKRLFASNAVSGAILAASFGTAVYLHEAKSKEEEIVRKVSFIQQAPKPQPKEAEKPKPPPPKKKPAPKKQRLAVADRKMTRALVAPKEVPKVAEKPPEVIEEDTVHLSVEGTLDETVGEIGGQLEKPPPGPTGPGGPGEGTEPEPPPKPKPIAKPKTIFLRADMPKPERVSGEDPTYPDAAKQAGIEGTVVLLFTITPEGTVTNIRVIKDLPILGELCKKVVRSWKFKPFIYQGAPTSVIMRQPFTFKLTD
jgi:protein TonB